ncbi:MAG TPA: hypothetical protein VID26_12345 [Candidatus Limnocylindrales bacterium]|jgi:hypothetical protein
MAKNGTTADLSESSSDVDEGFRTVLERGRSVADHLPDAVAEARSALDAAQGQLDLLSDRGVIAAVGYCAGITTGLFLAGAPRAILAISVVPLAVTVRSALTRGVRLSRLVN